MSLNFALKWMCFKEITTYSELANTQSKIKKYVLTNDNKDQ